MMDEALNVICLGSDPAVTRSVVALLGKLPGFAITTTVIDYQAGVVDLHRVGEAQLAIVFLGPEPLPGLTVIEEVHRALPATQVVAVAPEERAETIVKAMRAGADEFLTLPLDGTALLKVCVKLSALRGASTGSRSGQVWVAHGPKGGVGVTTLVANLGFALRAAQRETALVDLDVHSGDLALFLNLASTYSLRDIATNYKRLDPVFMQGTMVRHRSGLSVLAAPPPTPGEPVLELTGEQTLAVLELLDATHQVTVVDTSSVPLEATQAALSCADRIFLVTELTLPALRACVRALDGLRLAGIELDRTVELVVNKYANRSWEVAPAEAAKTLGVPIRVLIPREDAAVYTAVNSGLPLEEVRGGATVQRAIAGLLGDAGNAEHGRPVLKGFRRLFGGSSAEGVR